MERSNHNHTGLIAALLAVGTLWAACTTNPQPFPLPLAPPDTKAIFASTEHTQPTIATGLPGAVSNLQGGEEIVLAVPPLVRQQRGPVFSDGSFAVKLDTIQIDDKLEVWVELAGESSSHVTVPLPPVDWDAAAPMVDSISPVQSGVTVVRGQYNAKWQMLVANLHNGAAAMAVVDDQGMFAVTIAAAAGDSLAVFSREPESGATTISTEVKVPGA